MATSKTAAAPGLPKEPKDKAAETSTQKTVATKATAESTAPENDFLGLLEYVFKLYKESLEALKLNLVTFIMLALVPLVLVAIAVPFVVLPAVTDGGTASILVMTLALIVLFIIGCIFLPALTITQLESAKGNKIEFNEVFERSKPLVLPYIGLTILTGLAVMIGFIFLIIPGLIAAFFLTMSTYILVDKKTGVIDSMKASIELVKDKWQWVLAIFIIQAVISGVSSIVPFLGAFIGIAGSIIYYCLPAIVYLKIKK